MSAATASATATLSGKALAPIAFDVPNWPVADERAPWAALVHFDLAELKEKRAGEVHDLVLAAWRWWLLLLCTLGVNVVTSIALSAAIVGPAYAPGLAVTLSITELLLGAAFGFFIVHRV